MSVVTVRWVPDGEREQVEETFEDVLEVGVMNLGSTFLGWRLRCPGGVYHTVLAGRVEMLTERQDADSEDGGRPKLALVLPGPGSVQ